MIYKFLLLAVLIISISCADEEKCGFIMNNGERVAWKELPVRISIDSSMPFSTYQSIFDVLEEYNEALDRQVFILDQTSSNTLYWEKEWKDSYRKMASTYFVYLGPNMVSSDIIFNAEWTELLIEIRGFKQLLRHELGHVLGLDHTEEGLMKPEKDSLKEEEYFINEKMIENLKCEYGD